MTGRQTLAVLAVLLLAVHAMSAAAPAATADGTARSPGTERLVMPRMASADGLARARRLARDGRVDQAIAFLERLRTRHPADLRLHNELAVLYAERGELERARGLLERAMSLHPDYARLYGNLQAIYAALAAEAYDRALHVETGTRTPPVLASLADDDAREASIESEHIAPDPARTAEAATGEGTGLAVVDTSARTQKPPVAHPEGDSVEPDSSQVSARATSAGPEVVSGATTPHTTESPTARRSDEVAETVRGWADAWARQDVGAYLFYYGHHFVPGRGVSRDRWVTLRRRRVSAPAFIEVALSDLAVSLLGPDRARARFTQAYRSDTLTSTVTKVLRLSRKDGRWKIVRETVE